MRPQRWQPTRLPYPWDSPSKNTGVGCHFLLQYMKVTSESEVAQLCLTLCDPMDIRVGHSLCLIFEYIFKWSIVDLQCCPDFFLHLLEIFPHIHWCSSNSSDMLFGRKIEVKKKKKEKHYRNSDCVCVCVVCSDRRSIIRGQYIISVVLHSEISCYMVPYYFFWKNVSVLEKLIMANVAIIV